MSRYDNYFQSLRVTAVRSETRDAISFELDVPAELADRYRYASGQFCTIGATINDKKFNRAYSMSSSPEWNEPFCFTVKRVPGGAMSNWLVDNLAVGDVLDVSAPAGLFVADAGDAPLVCFSAGSGITPVYALVKTVLVTTERRISLLYANRDDASIIFARELTALTEKWPDRFEIHHHLDSNRGFVTQRQCADFAASHSAGHAYICGPDPFMAIAAAGLGDAGYADSNITMERFDGALPASDEQLQSLTEEVVIRLSGRTHTLPYRAGETILATARRAGLNPPFSCQAGNCATCIAMVREGAVAMKINEALDEDEVEEGWILTCQALPTTTGVVVDYDA